MWHLLAHTLPACRPVSLDSWWTPNVALQLQGHQLQLCPVHRASVAGAPQPQCRLSVVPPVEHETLRLRLLNQKCLQTTNASLITIWTLSVCVCLSVCSFPLPVRERLQPRGRDLFCLHSSRDTPPRVQSMHGSCSHAQWPKHACLGSMLNQQFFLWQCMRVSCADHWPKAQACEWNQLDSFSIICQPSRDGEGLLGAYSNLGCYVTPASAWKKSPPWQCRLVPRPYRWCWPAWGVWWALSAGHLKCGSLLHNIHHTFSHSLGVFSCLGMQMART